MKIPSSEIDSLPFMHFQANLSKTLKAFHIANGINVLIKVSLKSGY